jgi:hypothetical protein
VSFKRDSQSAAKPPSTAGIPKPSRALEKMSMIGLAENLVGNGVIFRICGGVFYCRLDLLKRI